MALGLVPMPAPHVALEALAADAWLLGQRERARALYGELSALAPSAAAYGLVRHVLEGPPDRVEAAFTTRADATERRGATLPPEAEPRPAVEVVVLLRSRGRANVPVRLDGELIGDTGEAGVLHVHLRAPEGRELALELDTSEVPALTPPSPRQTVRVDRARPVQTFDVTFELPRREPQKPKKRLPQRATPYRMD